MGEERYLIYNLMYVVIAVIGLITIGLGVNLLVGKKHFFRSTVATSPTIRKASAALIITIGVEWLYDVVLAASIGTDEELVRNFGVANMLDGITFEVATFVWLFSLLQPQSFKPYLWMLGLPMVLPLTMLVCFFIDPQEFYYEVFNNVCVVYIAMMSVFFIFSARKYNRLLTEHYTNHKRRSLRPLNYALAMYFVSITINSFAFNGHSEERSVPLTLLDIACFVALTFFIIWIAETQQMIVRSKGMPVGYVPNLLQRGRDGLCLAEKMEAKLADASVMEPLQEKDDLCLEDVAQAIGYEPAYLLCYLDLKHTTFNKYFNAKK